MPRLLVWRKQSSTALYKKGDVISVVPDSHEFSQSEIDDSHTTIIDLDGISLDKARQLLEKKKTLNGEFAFSEPGTVDQYSYSDINKWYFDSIADHFVTPEEVDIALTNREGLGVFTETEANTYG